SCIMPVSASVKAQRLTSVACQPISSHPISGIGVSGFSGYHSSQSRMLAASARTSYSQVCSEKSAYTLGLLSKKPVTCVYGGPPWTNTNFVLCNGGSLITASSSTGFAPLSLKYPPQPAHVWM